MGKGTMSLSGPRALQSQASAGLGDLGQGGGAGGEQDPAALPGMGSGRVPPLCRHRDGALGALCLGGFG